jgi:hypothetical protein
MGTVEVKHGRGVTLTTHPHLVSAWRVRDFTFVLYTSILNYVRVSVPINIAQLRNPRTVCNLHHHWLDSPMLALVFLRSFCQLKYTAIASSNCVTRVFSRVGLSAPRPTSGYPGGPMFSVRVVSLSWLVPALKRQDLAFVLAWLSHINVAQEPWRGHTCNGLGMNKWHYSSFVSIHLSARCVPSRPRTTPSTPIVYNPNTKNRLSITYPVRLSWII